LPSREFRLTGAEADITSFLRVLEYEEDLEVRDVSEPAPSTRAGDRLGHVELVDVIISVAAGVASAQISQLITRAFATFRETRTQLYLDDLGDDTSAEARDSALR
jgi:hypothetical protein